MLIRPDVMAKAMRAGALASGSRMAIGANFPASRSGASCTYRFAIRSRPMATASAKATTTSTRAASKKTSDTTAKSKARKSDSKATKADSDVDQTAEFIEPSKKQERLEAKKLIAEHKELEEKGLYHNQPKRLPTNMFTLFMSRWATGKSRNPVFGDNATEYKNISSAEREELRETVQKNLAANDAAYKTWVQSHTPMQILEANKARSRLARITKKKRISGISVNKLIKDDRLPKRCRSAYNFFVQSKARGPTGGDRELTMKRMTDTASAWRNLPASERKVFEDLAAAEKLQHDRIKDEVNKLST